MWQGTLKTCMTASSGPSPKCLTPVGALKYGRARSKERGRSLGNLDIYFISLCSPQKKGSRTPPPSSKNLYVYNEFCICLGPQRDGKSWDQIPKLSQKQDWRRARHCAVMRNITRGMIKCSGTTRLDHSPGNSSNDLQFSVSTIVVFFSFFF